MYLITRLECKSAINLPLDNHQNTAKLQKHSIDLIHDKLTAHYLKTRLTSKGSHVKRDSSLRNA